MHRSVTNLNHNWRFFRGECPDARDPAFDYGAWRRIGLPHCFDAPYFRTPEFYVGEGWYRRRIDLAANQLERRRSSLEFDGVFQSCDVFVDGALAGSHQGGYTSFSIDLSPHLKRIDPVIAVRVDNHWNPRLAPRAGEHIFSGGVYRDVRLVVTHPVHVPHCGHAITTPLATKHSARVNVMTTIVNSTDAPAQCSIETLIISPDGRVHTALRSHVTLPAGGSQTIEQQSDDMADPQLWHPDSPQLYRARTTVRIGEEMVDQVETPFGIRSIEWTADRGFFLNGEHLYLRGANVHQDHAGWGIGITRAACWRDVKLMKDAGFNFIRGAHYPHHPAFAEACDRLGMLFWSEATFWGKGGFGPEGYWNASAYPVNREDEAGFEQSCLDQLSEMIRTNCNHPSIICWSMCNEPFFTYHLDRAKLLLRKMVERSRALDPTRPAAIGGAQRGEIDHIGDIAGYNGDGARLFINPGVANMVSEYGAISKPPGAFEPFYGDLLQEQFAWRAGEAIWCGCDYGTIAGKQGLKGIVTHARHPKQSWHWYRQHNLGVAAPPAPVAAPPGAALRLVLESDAPCVKHADGIDDVQIVVTVADDTGQHIDATLPITLAIESGPGEFPTGRSITFAPDSDIAIFHGQAAIAMRSYFSGRTTIRATARGYDDSTITIETIHGPKFSPDSPRNDERPYAPPTESEAARRALRNAVNIALNRPSRASSESPDHPARRANEGDANSAWHALPDDAQPTWTLDLEGFYDLASIKLLFPAAGNWRFFIDTSLDRATWTRAINRTESINEAAARTDVFDPGLSARYLRITFTRIPTHRAGLAEIEVYGILTRS